MPPTSAPDTIIIEADTAEDALEQITDTLGADAEILSAEMVSTGGIAGFFARETVRITARPRSTGVDLQEGPPELTASEPEVPETFNVPSGVDAALERMINEADTGLTTFQEALEREFAIPQQADHILAAPAVGTGILVEEPPIAGARSEDRPQTAAALRMAAAYNEVTASEPSQPRLPEVESGPAAPGTGRVRWSVAGLTRLGLPTSIIESVVGLDPRDDMGWITAIARAVTPYCRPLPQGSAVIAGPRAQRLGWALKLPSFSAPELPPYGGSIITTVSDEPEELAWLDHVRGDRWLHVAVDDEPWHGVVAEDPIAVSWTSARGVAAAVALASTTGAVLGYGMSSEIGAPAVRANPLDVAVALRTLMERE